MGHVVVSRDAHGALDEWLLFGAALNDGLKERRIERRIVCTCVRTGRPARGLKGSGIEHVAS